jgi:aryl-alcohol dehydrogenase-like predicted oxidoreductase
MKSRKLGRFDVAELGLGCMSASHAYGVPPPAAAAERLLCVALEHGVTLFDTAALYGFGKNEELVGRVLRAQRSKIVLATKGGMTGVDIDGVKQRVIDGRPASIRRDCEASLQRLGTDVIDLYYLHRVDWGRGVPVEDSVGEMARLVAEGKVRELGLSEVSADTLRRAHAVHPIAALQSEYSLWSRNPELGALSACAELGVTFVAFSPLGRGFLSGELHDVEALPPKDIRRGMPRFAPQNYASNLRALEAVRSLAREVGCSPAQLALAWLLHRPLPVIPIPGTTSVPHLLENLAASQLTLDEQLLTRVGHAMNDGLIQGARYAPATLAEVDTERFE